MEVFLYWKSRPENPDCFQTFPLLFGFQVLLQVFEDRVVDAVVTSLPSSLKALDLNSALLSVEHWCDLLFRQS